MSENYRHRIIFLALLFGFCQISAAKTELLEVSVSKFRTQTGDTVIITVDAGVERDRKDPLQALLLRPSAGTETLRLTEMPGQRGHYRGVIYLKEDSPEGLYTIHCWTGNQLRPSSLGKATFLYGKIIVDFFIAAYLDTAHAEDDLQRYLQDFGELGGNFLIAHGLITPKKAYFPSRIAQTDVSAATPGDVVELLLTEADRRGFAVLLSVSWDMTRQSRYRERMGEITAIMAELYDLYQHHPSLAGFYSYQEGSGTYFVPYVREFSQQVKSLNPNLLSACAPHIDDPLLAGYLSTVDELDMIIWQSAVMASYRTDNRKKYPIRRVRDFEALAAGAKRLQNKLAVMHVELFGYLENRPNPDILAASYENIIQQILSVATVTASDGISLFSYHAHVYQGMKRHSEVARSREAVADGLTAFHRITSEVSYRPNPVAVYFPYSDWIVERWSNYFLPALDALRSLGVPVDILPYAPAFDESTYPYYPIHMNQEVLKRLLRERTVLIFPNISGFQQTDSDLIKAYVEQGGVVIAFGPQIPMGRSYERRKLFGGREVDVEDHDQILVKNPPGKRTSRGEKITFHPEALPAWESSGAKVIACYEDSAAAFLVNEYGQGKAFTILPDARTAVHNFPGLTRDIIEAALQHSGSKYLADVSGLNENTDLAMVKTGTGFCTAIVNHNPAELPIMLTPLVSEDAKPGNWRDLVTGKKLDSKSKNLILTLPPRAYRCIEFRQPTVD